MNTCVSRNLLLVPPKVRFIKCGVTEKRWGGVCLGGDFFNDFFIRNLDSQTEWNWTEFLGKESVSTLIKWCHEILFSNCPLFQYTKHMNLIQESYFNFKKIPLNLVPASVRCRGTFANKLFLLFN